MNTHVKNQVAKLRGDAGERFAVSLYQQAKFRIIATDLRFDRGQIDFLAERNKVFHFVEVKYRKTLEAAHGAINTAQLTRIAMGAEAYMMDHPKSHWQIDALLIDQDFKWQRIDNISPSMH